MATRRLLVGAMRRSAERQALLFTLMSLYYDWGQHRRTHNTKSTNTSGKTNRHRRNTVEIYASAAELAFASLLTSQLFGFSFTLHPTGVSLLPVRGCGTIYRLSCDSTSATDNSSDSWKHLCSGSSDHGASWPLIYALDILLLTYLLNVIYVVSCFRQSLRVFTVLLYDYSLTSDLEKLFSNVHFRDEYLW